MKWYLHKNSQAVKKLRPMQKKAAWKSCEIQGGGPEVAVMAKVLITKIQENLEAHYSLAVFV